jgi:hypothetical protein
MQTSVLHAGVEAGLELTLFFFAQARLAQRDFHLLDDACERERGFILVADRRSRIAADAKRVDTETCNFRQRGLGPPVKGSELYTMKSLTIFAPRVRPTVSGYPGFFVSKSLRRENQCGDSEVRDIIR